MIIFWIYGWIDGWINGQISPLDDEKVSRGSPFSLLFQKTFQSQDLKSFMK